MEKEETKQAEEQATEQKPKWSRKKKYTIVQYDISEGTMTLDKKPMLDESAKSAMLEAMEKEVIARAKAKLEKPVVE